MKNFKLENLKKYYILSGFVAAAFLAVGVISYFIIQLSLDGVKLGENDIVNLGQIAGDGNKEKIIREFIGVARATLSNTGEPVAIRKFLFEKGSPLDESAFFYVEYINDGDKKEHKILLKKISEGNYEVSAGFSKRLGNWRIETGEDLLFSKELVAYEKEGSFWKLINP